MTLYEDSLEAFKLSKNKTIPSKFDDWSRYISSLIDSSTYTDDLSERRLPYIHSQHRIKMSNYLYDLMTIVSLETIINCLDGLIIKPDQVFSFWHAVGKPISDQDLMKFNTKKHQIKDYKVHGTYYVVATMLYYSALFTELDIIERKGLDVEMDPYLYNALGILEALDASVRYPMEDLKISNKSNKVYQLKIVFKGQSLRVEWRSLAMPQYDYDLYIERQDICRNQDKDYFRHNVVYCQVTSLRSGRSKIYYINENHKLLLYKPKKCQHIEVGHA